MKTITAKDAKQIADNAHLSKQTAQLIKIRAAISDAANNGKYEVFFYENIEPAARTVLEQDGFTVGKTQFDRDETLTKITWDKV